MSFLLLGGVGVVFTALLLVVPATHLATWTGAGLDPTLATLIAVPVLLLLAGLTRPHPGLLLFGFPVSHLPALVYEPQLTLELVKTGVPGVLALAALTAVGAAWVVVSLRVASPVSARAAPPEPTGAARRVAPSARLLTRLVLLMSLLVYGAFAAAALSRPDAEPLAANIALLVGVAAAWYGVGRVILGHLGDLLYEPKKSGSLGEVGRGIVMRVLIVRRPSGAELWGTAILVGLAAAVALVWYLLYGT